MWWRCFSDLTFFGTCFNFFWSEIWQKTWIAARLPISISGTILLKLLPNWYALLQVTQIPSGLFLLKIVSSFLFSYNLRTLEEDIHFRQIAFTSWPLFHLLLSNYLQHCWIYFLQTKPLFFVKLKRFVISILNRVISLYYICFYSKHISSTKGI